MSDSCDCAAYITEPDDTDIFSCNFEYGTFLKSEIFTVRPFSRFHTLWMGGNVAGYVEQMSKNHLCDRLAAVSRYIGNYDTSILCRFYIDDIIPSG